MPLDAHYLQVFKAVLAECSMSRAATHLRTSASNVKRIVSVLEEELGVPLFAKESRGNFQPTSHADRLEREMAGFMQEMDSLQAFVAGMREDGRVLRVGAQRWLGETAYFSHLFHLLRQDTRFRATYVEIECGQERAMVESGACDVFVGLTTPGSKRLAIAHLPSLPMCLGTAGPCPPVSHLSDLAEVTPWGLHAPELRASSKEWLQAIESAGGGAGRSLPTAAYREWLADPGGGGLKAVISPAPASARDGSMVYWHALPLLPGVPVRATFLSQHPYGCLEHALQKVSHAWNSRHEHSV